MLRRNPFEHRAELAARFAGSAFIDGLSVCPASPSSALEIGTPASTITANWLANSTMSRRGFLAIAVQLAGFQRAIRNL